MGKTLMVMTMLVLAVATAHATQFVIKDVPAYAWYHGCGPTAAASILGYYDMHGYDNLFDASGWEDVSLTKNVKDEISSPEHNAKYDRDPNIASLPDPQDTSIADFFHTSETLPYGWSYLSSADNAFTEYAAYRGYDDWSAWNSGFSRFSFTDLMYEIDNNSPLMFLVDTDGNGRTDHFVPIFGYNDATMQYACYTTWSEGEDIRWHDYQSMGNRWGVGYATIVRTGIPDTPAPIPEPATMLLFGTGLAALAGYRKRQAKIK
jgi:hypothetical protein